MNPVQLNLVGRYDGGQQGQRHQCYSLHDQLLGENRTKITDKLFLELIKCLFLIWQQA